MTLRQRITVYTGLALVLIAAAYVFRAHVEHVESRQVWQVAAPTPAPQAMPDGFHKVELLIRKGDTIGRLLSEVGLPVQPVLDAASSTYDLTRLRPDRALEVVYTSGQIVPSAVRYGYDEDHTLVVKKEGETWYSSLETVEYTTAQGTRTVVLTRSLWEDGLNSGLTPDDLTRLAAIFEYEVDFNTELAEGARFTIVADILTPVAKTADATAPTGRERLSTIYATRLDNGSKTLSAIRFASAGSDTAYFHPDGSGMKRPFLRSPLEFSRVTSGFNPRRFHPILKIRRPHNGTDFGAPTGTPIRSVADAVVEFAGRDGGNGNFIKLRHEGGFQTSYSHLSSIQVRKGAKVKQGDLIGKVGTTGLSTGPHLHYQMWRAGRFVNAMTVDLPRTGSVAVANRGAFLAEASKWTSILEQAVATVASASSSSDEPLPSSAGKRPTGPQ